LLAKKYTYAQILWKIVKNMAFLPHVFFRDVTTNTTEGFLNTRKYR